MAWGMILKSALDGYEQAQDRADRRANTAEDRAWQQEQRGLARQQAARSAQAWDDQEALNKAIAEAYQGAYVDEGGQGQPAQMQAPAMPAQQPGMRLPGVMDGTANLDPGQIQPASSDYRPARKRFDHSRFQEGLQGALAKYAPGKLPEALSAWEKQQKTMESEGLKAVTIAALTGADANEIERIYNQTGNRRVVQGSVKDLGAGKYQFQDAETGQTGVFDALKYAEITGLTKAPKYTTGSVADGAIGYVLGPDGKPVSMIENPKDFNPNRSGLSFNEFKAREDYKAGLRAGGDGTGGTGRKGGKLSASQQRANASIIAARNALTGVQANDPRLQKKITDEYGGTVDNPRYDSWLAEQVKLANQRLYGEDPNYTEYLQTNRGLKKPRQQPRQPSQNRQPQQRHQPAIGDRVLAEALDAINEKAPREAVRARLKQMGYNDAILQKAGI